MRATAMGAERKAAVKQQDLIIKLRAQADEASKEGKLLRLGSELAATRQQVLTEHAREKAQHVPA